MKKYQFWEFVLEQLMTRSSEEGHEDGFSWFDTDKKIILIAFLVNGHFKYRMERC